ncbi:MAG: hypothetical protein J6Y60_13615 [Treponema sp.]|nr:hypothetical protein [Treponema sp.]
MLAKPFIKWVGGKSQSNKGAKVLVRNSDQKNSDINDDFFDDLGVPAKAVGCYALRYCSSSSLSCGGLLRRCSIA